jgi:hypothetical protein
MNGNRGAFDAMRKRDHRSCIFFFLSYFPLFDANYLGQKGQALGLFFFGTLLRACFRFSKSHATD